MTMAGAVDARPSPGPPVSGTRCCKELSHHCRSIWIRPPAFENPTAGVDPGSGTGPLRDHRGIGQIPKLNLAADGHDELTTIVSKCVDPCLDLSKFRIRTEIPMFLVILQPDMRQRIFSWRSHGSKLDIMQQPPGRAIPHPQTLVVPDGCQLSRVAKTNWCRREKV